MQEAIPANDGGMLAILGSEKKIIESIINDKNHDCCTIDNSPQQIVVSGLKKNLELFSEELNKSKIKY